MKILIVDDPGCAYQQVMLDLFANNDLFDLVVISQEEYYNVGTLGYIDHGKDRFHGKSIPALMGNYCNVRFIKSPEPIDPVKLKPNRLWYRQGEKNW